MSDTFVYRSLLSEVEGCLVDEVQTLDAQGRLRYTKEEAQANLKDENRNGNPPQL